MKKQNSDISLILIFAALGFIWARSSYGKLTGGTFVSGLGQTLTKFASNNPYPWYKQFLQNVAIPNSTTFGLMTMWGEVLVALAILGGTFLLLTKGKLNGLVKWVMVLGLIGAMMLNLTFWLASGWTSPSTDGLNLLMFAVELSGVYYLLKR